MILQDYNVGAACQLCKLRLASLKYAKMAKLSAWLFVTFSLCMNVDYGRYIYHLPGCRDFVVLEALQQLEAAQPRSRTTSRRLERLLASMAPA